MRPPFAAYWVEIGSALGPQSSVVALTEDYGNRLAYFGWQKATLWPSWGDLYQAQARGNPRDVDQLFDEMAAKKSVFLITDLEDLDKQPQLQARLSGFPQLIQGEGYLIYDLEHPLGDGQ